MLDSRNAGHPGPASDRNQYLVGGNPAPAEPDGMRVLQHAAFLYQFDARA